MVISKISFKFLIFTQIENRSVIWNQLSDNIQNLKRKLLHFMENILCNASSKLEV